MPIAKAALGPQAIDNRMQSERAAQVVRACMVALSPATGDAAKHWVATSGGEWAHTDPARPMFSYDAAEVGDALRTLARAYRRKK
jgi:hypothetical protein